MDLKSAFEYLGKILLIAIFSAELSRDCSIFHFLCGKQDEVPQRFYIHGVPFNLVICSDRGYLEHSDLPCLVQDSRVVIDISGAHQSELQGALDEIRSEADSRGINVIVGMPFFVDGYRRNCAHAIGDDGSIKTRYTQISASRADLFQAVVNALPKILAK